ncbi:hypothetical protein NU688_16775 [Variovorax sp. ZS18.2.2]|uniref:hypothetical protein n=1 Tax=Variovorax sp. ZS18.2.2 TaxID=2971255 RepID=UPI002151656A|nr:hypothetical protein [Variovorax sp. ZS18.2.2]MCR6477818.1 hypothetical protein [Variovorax sp. ZS18.2.2]
MLKPTRVDAFDHVKLRLTGPLSAAQRAELELHCSQLTHEGVDVSYAPNWPYVLEVSQPHVTFFPTLLPMLGTAIAAEPAGAEVARDYTTRFRIEANRMLRYFLQTVTLRHGPQTIKKFKQSVYFGRRARTRRLVLYADRRSKLSTPSKGQYCLHTEVRLKGSPVLRAAQLGTVAEFHNFDFDGFWDRNMRFWEFGSRSALGKSLKGKSTSDQAVHARARRMFSSKRYLVGTMFVLQKAMAANPSMIRALNQISAKTWEKNARNAALNGFRSG